MASFLLEGSTEHENPLGAVLVSPNGVTQFVSVLLARPDSPYSILDLRVKILPDGSRLFTTQMATHDRLKQALQELGFEILGEKPLF